MIDNLSAIEMAAKRSPAAWWENYACIAIKEGELERNEPGVCRLPRNRLQVDVDEIEQWCRENGVPCRIIGLKARQVGLTTKSVKHAYHRLARRRSRACIIGDEYEKSVKNMVRMFDTYAREDRCRWNNPYNPESKMFSSGSELMLETANDPRAGASGTFQVLICTEVAHWPDTGQRSAQKTLAAVMSCVPKKPDTIIIIESTAKGMHGAYYDTYQKAVTFEEFKAGKRGNGFIKLFYAWWEHWEYTTDQTTGCTEEEAEHIMATLTPREVRLIERFNLKPDRLKWRREAIAGPDYNGDEETFDQEYPADDVECFLAAGRMAFQPEDLNRVEALGKVYPATFGCIDRIAHRVAFRETLPVEAWATIFERPIAGRKYLLIVDPATGEERTTGEDPDRHSVLVLRAGQRLQGIGWVPPMPVARVKAPCYVALDALADWIDRLSWFYGRCMVALEINNSGLALYEALKPYNVPLYEREVFNFKLSTSEKKIGWETNAATRRQLLEALQKAVRDTGKEGTGVAVACPHTMEELRKFIINAKGRAEAARGHHDDDVLALGIGLVLESFATMYNEAIDARPIPRDLRAAFDADHAAGNASAMCS